MGLSMSEKSAHEPGITTKHLLLFDTSPTIMNCITYQQQWDCESSNRHLAVKALRSVNSYGVGMAMTTRIGGDVLMLGGFDSSQLCLVDGKELP